VCTFTATKRPPSRKRRERTKNPPLGCVAVPCLLRALEVEREETGEEEEEEEETAASAAICDDDERKRERDLFVTTKERERETFF
tara:strand:- start:1389 stop:1643 length:255 start_codon:yes stop_codon:yes gene_type:complete